jgi:mono/diheme cytochrome c family protein
MRQLECFSSLHHVRAKADDYTVAMKRLSAVSAPIFGALVFTSTISLSAGGLQEHQHPATGGMHRHPEAAKISNPVAADAKSIAAGQQLYQKHCSSCHGETGKGDGMMGEELDPKPSDLTDAEWKHGSSDGEIFAVIRDGVKGTGMKPFARKMTAHEMWDVVNYLRSIGPRPTGNH